MNKADFIELCKVIVHCEKLGSIPNIVAGYRLEANQVVSVKQTR